MAKENIYIPEIHYMNPQDKNNGSNPLNENLKKNLDMEIFIKKIALIFHEEWRKNRLQDDGTYKPMIEKSEDETRTKTHGTNTVDIANTEFEDLPSNRKYENLEAAKVAVNLVYDKIVNGENISSEMIEEMSKIVHEKWLERNGIGGSFENQRVAYENLSEYEKEKDRAQIELAIKIIKSEI